MSNYRVTFNPATGEHMQYILTAKESGDVCVRYRWESDPGGQIVEHTHPGSAEIFTILEGEATFTVGDAERTLGPGESVVVPAGIPHSEANNSANVVRGIVELRPAAKTAELHDALAAISSTMPVSAAGAPKNPLQLGATFWLFRNDLRATKPPVWMQNLFLPPLALAARVAGVKGFDADWSSRLPTTASVPDKLFDETAYATLLANAGYDFPLHEVKTPKSFTE